MAEGGKIRASDLLDEKALILFRELQELTQENIKAIEKLRETNVHLGNVTMKNGKDSIALQQKMLANLREIDALRKVMINKELESISTKDRADKKRKAAHDKEIKRIKTTIDLHEKEKNAEEAAIKKILKIRTAAAKKAEAAESRRAAKFIADAKREAAAVVSSQKKSRAARKATITAISTGFLAMEVVWNRVSSAFNKLIDKLKVLDNFNNLMTRLTGTTSQAADTMEYLITISRQFGLSLQVATERYSKFFAAAKQANLTTEETRKIFTSVAKVAGILGLAGHELGGVFLALEQMLSKGKVTTEELRRQLGERLPGAFGIMAKAVNELNPDLEVTVFNLDEMLKKGEIISAVVLPEFARQLEIAFNAIDVIKVETLAAAQSEFGTSITQLLYTLEQGKGAVSNFFRGVFDGLTSNIDAMTELIILQEISYEERVKLNELENKASGLRDQATFFGLIGLGESFAENAERATVAAKLFKQELIKQVKYDQQKLRLAEDYTKILLGQQLDLGKLTEEHERILFVEEQYALALKMTNDELNDFILKSTEAFDINAKNREHQGGTLDYYDALIKQIQDILKADISRKNINDQRTKNLQNNLEIYKKIRKELSLALGLEDKSNKKKKSNKDGARGKVSDDPFAPEGSVAALKQQISLRKKELAVIDRTIPQNQILIDSYNFQIQQLQEQLDIYNGIKKVMLEMVDMDPVAFDDYFNTKEHSTRAAQNKSKPSGIGSQFLDDDKLRKQFLETDTAKGIDQLANPEEFEDAYIDFEQTIADSNSKIWDQSQATMNQLFDIGSALFDRRIEELNAEMEAIDRLYDLKILRAKGDSELQRQLALEREVLLEELRRKELAERQKQAKLGKIQAIANATMNTAVAVTNMLGSTGPYGFVLALLAAAMGAAQIATIVATPIPQYKEGRKGGKKELAITGDGGKHEWIVGKNGVMRTPSTPTLTQLNKGDSVLKDDRALQDMIYQTLLKPNNIQFNENKGIVDAVIEGMKKAKVNNYVKMPKIDVKIDHALWVNKNTQFGR